VGLEVELLGRRLGAPLLVSAMTGGTREAAAINDELAAAATERGLAMVLGSGRVLLDDPSLLWTFGTASRPPLLLANLGVAQLSAERALRLVERLDADGLTVHLNPLQEALQPEGTPTFAGALTAIAETVDRLRPLPVVVKEVGFGLDDEDVRALHAVGVAAIDVAGAGGTNWALIEGRRGPGGVAEPFGDWGLSTRDALEGARRAAPAATLIASGGLHTGVDAAKCLALGARACGFARPLLVAAQAGRLDEVLDAAIEQLRIATWLAGAAGAGELGEEHLR
jgi:isopentenyl-diphosphate Delta-isomerase